LGGDDLINIRYKEISLNIEERWEVLLSYLLVVVVLVVTVLVVEVEIDSLLLLLLLLLLLDIV
jgi:hypothetical protein